MIHLTTCERVTSAAHDTPEWHGARKRGIGGSDASIIMGENPWTSPKQLFLLKTGRARPDAGNAYTRCGNLLEDAILERVYYGHATPGKKYGSMRSIERPLMLANIDGTYDGRLVEIKTTGKAWTRGVPAHYVAQVRHYLYVCGLDAADVVECRVREERGAVVACIEKCGARADRVVEHLCDLTTHRVEQDAEWLAGYLDACDQFWARVEADEWIEDDLGW